MYTITKTGANEGPGKMIRSKSGFKARNTMYESDKTWSHGHLIPVRRSEESTSSTVKIKRMFGY